MKAKYLINLFFLPEIYVHGIKRKTRGGRRKKLVRNEDKQ